MGEFEELKAAAATRAIAHRAPDMRVFWNDALKFYTVAQDRRKVMRDDGDGFFRMWHRQDRDLGLTGVAALRREHPNGMIPYHSDGGFDLTYKREGQHTYSAVEPRPEIILYCLDKLAPTIDSINDDQILEKSEAKYDAMVEKEWDDIMGPDQVAKDLAEQKRGRVIIASR